MTGSHFTNLFYKPKLKRPGKPAWKDGLKLLTGIGDIITWSLDWGEEIVTPEFSIGTETGHALI